MRRLWLCVGLLLVAMVRPSTTMAHVGAPYPVLLEEQVGPYTVSVLADPDVGTGTFYVMVAWADGESTPSGTVVTVWATPADGHGMETAFSAERQETRFGERFVARAQFDAKGPWEIRLTVEGPAGAGEITFPVVVTSAGTGWLATLMCLVPFVILGLLWLRGMRRQRAIR
jgi:hypothetical protein